MITFFGLAAPFEQRSAPLRRGSTNIAEMICRGAISRAALAAKYTAFEVDHDVGRRMPNTRLMLFNTRVGLYISARVPDGSVVRELLANRDKWRGVSISYDASTARCEVDWPSVTLKVLRITYVSGVSVITGNRRPGYATTWISTNRDDALARMRAEVHASRSAAFGSEYRHRHPKWVWGQVPQQCEALEVLIRRRDPNRTMLERLGELEPKLMSWAALTRARSRGGVYGLKFDNRTGYETASAPYAREMKDLL